MKIFRRIAVGGTPAVAAELKALGFDVPSDQFFAFLIDEADPKWPAVERWYASYRTGPALTETRFSAAELNNARSLHLSPSWHWSYPLPDEDFGYRETTYGGSSRCPSCGIGLVQSAPFTLRGEPKWGSRNILQINWVFGEYFVTPQLWSEVFAPFGIKSREVLSRKGTPLQSVVQLVIEQVVDLDMTCREGSVCPTCGIEKFESVTRGFRPEPLQPVASIAHSSQWFGSGHSANHTVLVSPELRSALLAAKAKGASFEPSGPCS